MKPFLKWAGNKYPLVERIKSVLPQGKRLIEPFVGSGALFLNTDFEQYYLSEINADLITVFNQLKNNSLAFIAACREFFIPENNTPEKFYQLREEFNKTRSPAIFIYLNKHCFNGLCRYNKNNFFNTPFGKYQKPYFPEKEMVFFAEKVKRAEKAEFVCEDFADCMDKATLGDVIYCDPPYAPLSKSSNFTGYHKNGFSETDQRLLAQKAEECQLRGIPVIISNQSTALIKEIYQAAEIHIFDVQRFISAKSDSRHKVEELLGVFECK